MSDASKCIVLDRLGLHTNLMQSKIPQSYSHSHFDPNLHPNPERVGQLEK